MRRVFPVLIIIILLGGFIFYTVKSSDFGENNDPEYLTEKRFLEISQSPSELITFVEDVKQNPDQVMNSYTVLRRMIYSENYEQEERESLINMMRMFFHTDLLDQNPKELHYLKIEAEREKWIEIEFGLIGSDFLPAEYYPVTIVPDKYDANNVAMFKVIFYTTDIETEEYQDTDIYLEYVLVQTSLDNTSNQWEILGWQSTDPFEIVK